MQNEGMRCAFDRVKIVTLRDSQTCGKIVGRKEREPVTANLVGKR